MFSYRINLRLESGSITAIVGLVGSGKSSLLSAILGEMERLEGYVTLNVSDNANKKLSVLLEM